LQPAHGLGGNLSDQRFQALNGLGRELIFCQRLTPDARYALSYGEVGE
jgi:hypothetical protein